MPSPIQQGRQFQVDNTWNVSATVVFVGCVHQKRMAVYEAETIDTENQLIEKSTPVFSSRYHALAVLIVLAIWCLVDVFPRGSLDPSNPESHRTDFTVYTEAGKAALEGKDPYSVSNARGWIYLYLPPFALLVSPLAYLPEGLQCVIWFWVSIACLYGAFREFATLDHWAFPGYRQAHSKRLAAWGGVVCMLGLSLSTLNCLQRGQVGVLQLYLTLLGTRLILVEKNRWAAFLGGTVLAGASILKLSPALPSVVLLLGLLAIGPISRSFKSSSRWAKPITLAGGLLAGLAVGIWIVPAAIVGWETNQTFLNTWRRDILSRTGELSHDRFAGDSHSRKNQSPMNGFWLLGNQVLRTEQGYPMDLPNGQWVLSAVRFVALLSTLVALSAILWRGKEKEVLIAFAVANAATLMIVPIARGHYFMAIWPVVVWLPRWLAQDRHTNPFLCQMLALTPPSLLILHYVFEGQLGAFGLLGVGIWIWMLLLTFTVLVSTWRAQAKDLAARRGPSLPPENFA